MTDTKRKGAPIGAGLPVRRAADDSFAPKEAPPPLTFIDARLRAGEEKSAPIGAQLLRPDCTIELSAVDTTGDTIVFEYVLSEPHWSRKEGATFIEFVAENLNVQISHIVETERGGPAAASRCAQGL